MRYLLNGQWSLEKSEPGKPSIHDLVGKTHTVEVHPDIDHLHRVKGLINESGKPHMQLADIKRAGISEAIVKKLPRDARGKVTSEMIDKHIEKLPKQKVEVKVVPYKLKSQQHRDAPQYVASVGYHPDTLKGMDSKHQNEWNDIKGDQHDLDGHEHQIGWSRIDPHKTENTSNGYKVSPNDKHWHLDEIQSDFSNKDKITDKRADDAYRIHREYSKASKQEHPLHEDWKKHRDATAAHQKFLSGIDPLKDSYKGPTGEAATAASQSFNEKVKDHLKSKKSDLSDKEIFDHLSHGHEDPQHLVHSAVNQLARQNGIESTSMDTPEDQAKQSHLQEFESDDQDNPDFGMDGEPGQREWELAHQTHHDTNFTPEYVKRSLESPDVKDNKYLHSAIEKVPHKELKNLLLNHKGDVAQMRKVIYDKKENSKAGFIEKHPFEKLGQAERDALAEYIGSVHQTGPQLSDFGNRSSEEDDSKRAELPVHQINTYNKRPKKLGAQLVDKASILGEHPNDKAKKIQYMKLHKNLLLIKELLNKKND